MSYWISLRDPETDETATVDRFQEGGTQPVGGTCEAELNVTYNYGVLFSFKPLHGKTGEETIPVLQEFSDRWKHAKPWKDYWAPTPGNVKAAVDRLLSWAKKYPKYRWSVV